MGAEILLPIWILALLDTLSPTTIGITVWILLKERERLTSRLMVYLLTVAIFNFLVGVSLMVGLALIFQKFSVFSGNAWQSQLMTFIGLGLLIGSFFVPTKASSPPPRKKTTSKSMLAMVMLGLTTGLIEVGTAFPYFAAIGMMTAATLTPSQWLPILASYNFIMILPPLLLIGGNILFRNWFQALMEKIRRMLENNSNSTLSWVMFILGLILLINS